MTENRIFLQYEGQIEYQTINQILNQFENEMAQTQIKRDIRRKAYSIIAEFLDNIHKHTAKPEQHETTAFEHPSRFVLIEDLSYFILESGNVIDNTSVRLFKNQLDRLNRLNQDALRKLYRYSIQNNPISVKGGAGLGVIDVLLKSGNNIEYEFKEINDSISYCKLKLKISKS